MQLPDPVGPDVTTSNIPVPANKCGLVIGKGELDGGLFVG